MATTIDGVTTTTDILGNTYTQSIQSDELEQSDFLEIMIAGFQNQDPTDPMDSDEIMETQLRMSQLQSNQEMTNAMNSLEKSYEQSSLSDASNLIGRRVESDLGYDNGNTKTFTVESVQMTDGTIYVNAHEQTGTQSVLYDQTNEAIAQYNSLGYIMVDDSATSTRVKLDSDDNLVLDEDNNIVFIDENGNTIENSDASNQYVYGGYNYVYSDDTTQISLDNIDKITI